MPLPPYIKRDPQKVSHHTGELDKERYQTVYSQDELVGSSAAPTAGLHFTENIISQCQLAGAEFVYVTLHVGLGTFFPIQTEMLAAHAMHEEHYYIDKYVASKICEYTLKMYPIFFVGTTSLRTTESFFRKIMGNYFKHHKYFCSESFSHEEFLSILAREDFYSFLNDYTDKWQSTNLFIFPQDKGSIIKPIIGDALITNFHQPESTLAALVAAIMGYDFWKKFYLHAVHHHYRFFSYGDSSLLIFR